jgi:hypothetical protein
MWVERQMQAVVADLQRVVDKKMSENEVAIRKILLKNGASSQSM